MSAVTRGTFTLVNDPFTTETALVSVTDISRGKFPVVNIHGYVKKVTRSAHDI